VIAEPGSRLIVTATAGEHQAQLEVIIVRHRASGWVRAIARKDEDQLIEAEFDPETGIVTVYEGRKEFRELERAARRGGYSKKRVAECVPYRMLEVERPRTPSTPGPRTRSSPAGSPKSVPPTLPSTPPPFTTNTRRSATARTTSSCRPSTNPRSTTAPSPSNAPGDLTANFGPSTHVLPE
jgi:hypothetical protein